MDSMPGRYLPTESAISEMIGRRQCQRGYQDDGLLLRRCRARGAVEMPINELKNVTV